MLNPIIKEDRMVLGTYDLCLACSKPCKGIGLLWCRLECPSFSCSEPKYRDYRIVDMTDKELISRIAYG